EVLLLVAGCGICGSDLHAVASDPGFEFMRPPVVMGHEFTGTIAVLGEGSARFSVGDRVIAMSIQGCGNCLACRRGDTHICGAKRIIGLHYDGGLAEYAVVAERHLVPVPAALDLVRAALAEPLSVAVHAVLERSTIRPGDRVIVSGPGPIGLFCGRLAQLAGGEVLMTGTESDAALRLPLAQRFGFRTVNVDRDDVDAVIADHVGGAGADAWIEASGAGPAYGAAIAGVRPGGTVTVVALFAAAVTFRPTDAVRRELSILFSYAARYGDFLTALRLLEDGSVDGSSLITPYALDDAGSAFDDARAGAVVKALVVPGR
ncbi:MAG: alcohol dehydrogenase catalytic domain-containing protein, partial [Mycobacteriales bacterium]